MEILCGFNSINKVIKICFRKQPKNSKEAKTVGPIEPEKLPPNANNQTTENGNLLNGNKVENPVFNSTPNIIETTLPTISSQYTATVKSGSTLHAPDYHSLSHKLTKQFHYLEKVIRIQLKNQPRQFIRYFNLGLSKCSYHIVSC